jgi:2'-5' RNA ligase
MGVYPPAETVRAMLRALASLHAPPHRPTPPEQVHLTLLFIGDTDPQDVPDVIESVERSAAGLGAFELRPLRLVTMPRRGAPRLIAATTDAPATMLEVQRRLATRLARNPRDRHPGRFEPHLTLCRFAPGARPAPMETAVELPVFLVEQIVLVRSELHPGGARHAPVHAVGLGA